MARAAGHRSPPVPPTFLFSLEMMSLGKDPFAWFGDVGLELRKILHGEQTFRYHAVAVAGDVLKFESRIANIYDKKNGALEFLVKETDVTHANGAKVARLESTIVQRNAVPR